MTIKALTDFDVYLWAEGTHHRAYEKLGAHLTERDGVTGTRFAVWAPAAREVSVIGAFNDWRPGVHPLHPVASSGIWEGFLPGVGVGALYKYALRSHHHDYQVEKADPYGFAAEIRPQTASKVCDLSDYTWDDADWMATRAQANSLNAPMSLYEVHLGSWRRVPEEGNRWLTYRELAPLLTAYLREMGYTHVELLPVSEHPFDGSWGYQTVGCFAPTSRFGSPQDFMFLIDALHQAGIGVILDWVPAHFPRDQHGLGFFDGTHLYEEADPRRREHKDWGTFVYDYGRPEVGNFLLSNALFWLDKYHIDGLRVDAVASMLYLDYSKGPGQWIPNRYGGRENLEAVDFLRRLNENVYREYPDVVTFAEESTAWPQVSRPTWLGGLGFGLKWDMGWMHDTLSYFQRDPVYRKFHHNRLTFRMLYAFTENYILPLSHDEVVHGKHSLLSKMPGDDWQKFANLRLLYGYQYAMPGKKLLFMGGEFGQWREWNHDTSLDWNLLEAASHEGLRRWVSDLNRHYRAEASWYELDYESAGFEWVDCNDADTGVICLLRKGREHGEMLLFVCNFTPVPRHGYGVGVPHGGRWDELLNSDSPYYGGSGQGNRGGMFTEVGWCHNRTDLLQVTVPPLGMVVFKWRP